MRTSLNSDWTVEDTVAAEVGTFLHDGHAFSAGGARLDFEHGRALVYVGPMAFYAGRAYHAATDWEGHELGLLIVTGKARGFGGARLTCYSTCKPLADGHHYYGRGLGEGMSLRLRRGRKAAR